MIGIIILSSAALIIGIILVIVDNKYENDELEKEILNLLPHLNCGACGFVSCKNMTNKILENKENIYKCTPLQKNKENIEEILNIIK